MRFAKTVAIAAILAAGLSGCVASQRHLSDDFGSATRQNIASQIADPDARYKGDPAPGSDGRRVGLAQERYRTGKVIEPVAVASKIGATSMAQPTGQ
jgi:type IV pilus biogenesis protein CpaD/CtpE